MPAQASGVQMFVVADDKSDILLLRGPHWAATVASSNSGRTPEA